MIKMTLTFDERTIETLNAKAKKEGFARSSQLVRYLLVRSLEEEEITQVQPKEESDKRTIHLEVNNYRELQGYAEERKLGNVAVLAVFSMERYMKQNSLSEAQKHRVEAKYGISLDR